MNKLTSLYLDLIRSLASISIVLHHYNNHIIGSDRNVFPPVGQEAVMVFFVLSGFVISWVVEVKETKLPEFIIKRFARFYSVMIPSIFIALLCYVVAGQLDSNIYPEYLDIGLNHIPEKTFLTLSFLNYNNFIYDVKLPLTDPFWSLTYEFWYYIIFALIYFLKSRTIKLLTLLFLFTFLGLKPLLLWPIWLIGVATYQLSKRVAWKYPYPHIIFVISLIALVLLHITNLRQRLSITHVFDIEDLAYSDNFLYFLMVGLCISLNLLAYIAWSKNTRNSIYLSKNIEKYLIRYPASVSFTLYLTHLPLMFLLKSLLGNNSALYLIPSIVIIIVLIVGIPIEQTKRWYYNKITYFLALIKDEYIRNKINILFWKKR